MERGGKGAKVRDSVKDLEIVNPCTGAIDLWLGQLLGRRKKQREAREAPN